MRRGSSLLLSLLAVLGSTGAAHADTSGVVIDSLDAMHRACEGAGTTSRPDLWVLSVEPGDFRFEEYEADDGFLAVDTTHNLRVLGGRARIFAAHLETLGFPAGPAEAEALAAEARHGASLRVGFFLGFDDPQRRACLIAPAGGVTQVRVEPAFVELYDAEGRLVSRTEGERLHAWNDDPTDEVPGEGPRGVVREVEVVEGTQPATLGPTVERANAGRLGRDLARCQAAAVQRGAATTAQVIVLATFEPRTGRVSDTTVELSTLRDEAGSECVAHAIRERVRAEPRASAESLVVRLPVLLRAD